MAAMTDLPPVARRIAAFDFGSNALKCSIAEQTRSGFKSLGQHRIVTRLGAAIDEHGALSEAAILSTLQAANKLKDICDKKGVTEYYAVGTQALRTAVNARDFVNRLHSLTGLQLQVIPAAEEARLAWLGALSSFRHPNRNILLFDSGGASTEIIISKADEIQTIHSLPLGAVSLAKEYIHSDPISDDDYSRLQAAIDTALKLPEWQGKLILSSGGGTIACGKVARALRTRKTKSINGFIMVNIELERQLYLYRNSTLAQRKQLPGMEKDRADIILVTAMIALSILHAYNSPGLSICTGGVRQGILWEQLCTDLLPHS